VLIFLAITKGYEPLLLIPIGFAAILANLPLANLGAYGGILALIYNAGIRTELLPPLIFLGVGVLTDFRPLLARPLTFLLGAAAQLGIFIAALVAFYLLGFTRAGGGLHRHHRRRRRADLHLHHHPARAAPAGRRGGGRVQLHVAGAHHPAADHAAADDAARARDRHAAGAAGVEDDRHPVPDRHGVLASLAVPSSAPLIGLLMFGNLLRESGVTDRLKKTAGGPMIDIVTILLGLVVGATMGAENFLTYQHAPDHGAGRGGVLVQHGGRHPAGQAAERVPARRAADQPVHRRGGRVGGADVGAGGAAVRVDRDEGRVNPLMPAMGPNVAGVIGSAVTAGVFLALLPHPVR
jgi:carboxybiotin decarboxylase